MEPESKVAPEAISAPIPDDLKERYEALCRYFGERSADAEFARRLIERIASLEQQLKAMTEDRDLWQDAHNDDCPNKILADAAEQQLAALKASHTAEKAAAHEAGFAEAREYLKDW